LNDPIVGWAEALAVQRGEQELLNFLNAWVTAHTADRWIDVTREHWFESRDWIKDVKR
jgi:polar amino acid transport system substrate-binding protein